MRVKETDIEKEVMFLLAVLLLYRSVFISHSKSHVGFPLYTYDRGTCRDTLPLHRISQVSHRGFCFGPTFPSEAVTHRRASLPFISAWMVRGTRHRGSRARRPSRV